MRKVLIVSKHNSCRSQIAEGWFRYYGAGFIEVFSAGGAPCEVDPFAVKLMSDAIIDISKQKPKGFPDIINHEFSFIICLGNDAGDLPTFKGSPEVLSFDYPDMGVKGFADQAVKTKTYEWLRDDLENLAFDFVHQRINPLY